MTKPTTAIHVVLGLPKRNKDIVAFAKNVQSSLTNNSRFSNPNIALAILAADIAAFDQAETAAANRGAGAATQRNAKRAKVVQDLRHLRDYVQGVVELLTADAITAVESAGLKARKSSVHHKQALQIKDGATSGGVHLVAKAVAHRATYYWQYSLDGKAWTSCPDPLQATTTIAGLTPGQAYQFRLRTLTRAGASDFSQVVTHLVR